VDKREHGTTRVGVEMTIVVEEDGTEREWPHGEMMEAYDPGYRERHAREVLAKLLKSDWYKEMFE